jgi:hypothetical protein
MGNEKTGKGDSGKNSLSRRNFLRTTAAASAAFTIIPSFAMGKKLGYQAPSDTLRVALVGAGSQGSGDISSICAAEVTPANQGMFGMTGKPGTEKLVAICDVDWGYAPVLNTFDKFPSAKKYKDWRVMLDEMGNSIDAVVVATADHNHANPAATAMTMENMCMLKNRLHTFMNQAFDQTGKKTRVATQMGNGVLRRRCATTCAWAGRRDREVRKVDVWSSRPMAQGLDTPR